MFALAFFMTHGVYASKEDCRGDGGFFRDFLLPMAGNGILSLVGEGVFLLWPMPELSRINRWDGDALSGGQGDALMIKCRLSCSTRPG